VKKAFVPRVLCKYYQRGKCTWGRGCKFLHPGVNDTGNYSFLEFQDPNAKVYQQQPVVSASATISAAATERPIGTVAANDTAETESAWERGLRHAKEMKEKALRRKQTEGEQFADKKMNLSLKEFENEKENDERYVNVERFARIEYVFSTFVFNLFQILL
jgi:nuclear protein NHN1